MFNYKSDLSIGLRLFLIISRRSRKVLQSRLDSGICLNDICLILLLFADDMVILSSTLEDLQLSLNNLS